VDTIADAEYKRAKTAETLANIDNEDQRLAVESARTISNMVTGRG
jgi:hypothetical protein